MRQGNVHPLPRDRRSWPRDLLVPDGNNDKGPAPRRSAFPRPAGCSGSTDEAPARCRSRPVL